MKIATVGAWHVHTQEYAEAIQKNPKAQLCCLWDDNQERGKAMAEKLGVPFQPDLDAIWADPTIEGVQVTTATNQHRDILLAAAKAGKHIFTEKVLALTNEDAEEIAQAVRESGVKFTISYPHKTWPTLKAAKALVDSGKLGKITYARVHNYHDGSVRPQADGSLGWLPSHFYDAAQTGGGAMMDLGAHPMYTLHWFLGEPKSIVSQFTEVTHRGVEDNAVSVIEFEGGRHRRVRDGLCHQRHSLCAGDERYGGRPDGAQQHFGVHLRRDRPQAGAGNRPAREEHHAYRRLD